MLFRSTWSLIVSETSMPTFCSFPDDICTGAQEDNIKISANVNNIYRLINMQHSFFLFPLILLASFLIRKEKIPTRVGAIRHYTARKMYGSLAQTYTFFQANDTKQVRQTPGRTPSHESSADKD